MPRTIKPLEERFASKVDKVSDPNGCWLWTGSTQGEGRYGQISLDGTSSGIVGAHRVAIYLATGVFPKGVVTRHKCPGIASPLKRCVNPAHLETGSYKDNSADAIAAGTFSHGETHGKAKLKVEDVKDVLRRVAAGESYASIARHYNVCNYTIQAAAKGKTWKAVHRELRSSQPQC